MPELKPDPILVELLSLPAAPFCEHYVIDYVLVFCKKRGIAVGRDRAGNILIRLRRGRKKIARPICFTAHMDHPGFVVQRKVGPNRVEAHWRGGVKRDYFVGSGVRFFEGDRWVRGKIEAVSPTTAGKPVRKVRIRVPQPVSPGAVGMWDFPDPVVKGSRLYARGCDCVAGVAALLCCIDRLHRDRASCDVYFLLTRAEEVGFVGAIAACRLETIPRRCVVVAVEISSRLPSAELGDGPILRVGDKSSIFTPAATAYCQIVADELVAAKEGFVYQRKLMDGGTCESTAYCQFGYDATGICIALGNYHNMDTRRKKIAPEFIDLGDWNHLVRWFEALATRPKPYDSTNAPLTRRLRDLEARYSKLLRQTAFLPNRSR